MYLVFPVITAKPISSHHRNVSDCMVYTTGSSRTMVHSHWSSLNNTYRNLSFVVKLWNPEEWHRVRLYLALSVLPIASSGSQIQEWHAGIELVLSNRKSGLVAGVKVCYCPRLHSSPKQRGVNGRFMMINFREIEKLPTSICETE